MATIASPLARSLARSPSTRPRDGEEPVLLDAAANGRKPREIGKGGPFVIGGPSRLRLLDHVAVGPAYELYIDWKIIIILNNFLRDY